MVETTYIVDQSVVGLFILAVVVSTILAYGFHFILSLLSVATGLSFIPNLKKASAKAHAKSQAKGDGYDDDEDDEDDDSVSMLTITSGIGLWTLVTTTLALFGATWLGMSLTPANPGAGIIGGLVVWAMFFITILYLEYRAAHTIVGGLISAAVSGLRASANSLSSMFSGSQASQVEKTAKLGVRAMYEEVDRIVRKDNVDNKLKRYISKLTPDVPTKRDIRKEVETLIDEIKVEEKITVDEGTLTRVLDAHIEKNPTISKEKVASLKSSIKQATEAAKSKDTKSDQALAALDSIAPMSDEDSKNWRAKIAGIIDNTSNEELNSDKFKEDLEKLFDDPKAGREQLMARLKNTDRQTIEEILSQHPELDQNKAQKITSIAMKVLDTVRSKNSGSDKSDNSSSQPISARIEGRIASYFDRMDHPSLNYDDIRYDVQTILEEPSSAPKVIKRKLAELDRSAIVEMLAANKSISHEQAEQTADRIVAARDDAMGTVTKISDEATRRYNQARRRAVLTAEHARKNAIAASWWLVSSALVSATGAILGAYMGSM